MAGRTTKRTTTRGESIPTDVLDDVLDAERAQAKKDQGLGPEFDDAARELREKMRLRDSQRLFEWRANEADAKEFDRESFRKRVKDIVGKGDAPSDPPPPPAEEPAAREAPAPAPHRTTSVTDERQHLVRWAALAVGLAAIVGMLIAKLVAMPSPSAPAAAPAEGATQATATATAAPTPTTTADASATATASIAPPSTASTSAPAKTSGVAANDPPAPRPSPTTTSPPPKPTTTSSGPGLLFTSQR